MRHVDKVREFVADRPYAFKGNISYPLTRREALLLDAKANRLGLALWPNPDGLDDSYFPGRFRLVDLSQGVPQ